MRHFRRSWENEVHFAGERAVGLRSCVPGENRLVDLLYEFKEIR